LQPKFEHKIPTETVITARKGSRAADARDHSNGHLRLARHRRISISVYHSLTALCIYLYIYLYRMHYEFIARFAAA